MVCSRCKAPGHRRNSPNCPLNKKLPQTKNGICPPAKRTRAATREEAVQESSVCGTTLEIQQLAKKQMLEFMKTKNHEPSRHTLDIIQLAKKQMSEFLMKNKK